MNNITNQIFEIAKTEKLSQKTIAQISGIPEETISRAKKRGNMNAENAEKIAAAMGYGFQLKKIKYPILNTSGAAWSSPSSRNDPSKLAARLSNSSFKDLVELCLMNGIPAVESSMESIKAEIPKRRYEVQMDMLSNIKVAIGSRAS